MNVFLCFLWIFSARAEEASSPSSAEMAQPLMADMEISTEEIESRTAALSKLLRCPVCQGLSIGDSRADQAVAMQTRVKELITKGYTDEQVKDFFIDRYGEWVLLRPKDNHRFIWYAPGAVVVFGLIFVFSRFRKKSSQESSPEMVKPSTEQQDDDGYRARILSELEGD